jgi:hypothetical protein
MIRLLAAALACLAGLGTAMAVRAQTSGPVAANVSVTYSPGWNMLGGPAGVSLDSVTYLYAYGPTGYVIPSTTTTVQCQGYWAYFSNTSALVLPGTPSGQTQVCLLQVGWTMVGNPFGAIAVLPAGMSGYYWNPNTSQYQTVTSMAPGAAAWIYSPSGGSVTLTSQAVTPSFNTLVISDLTSSGPFQVRVGDQVELLLPSASNFIATGSPSFNLQLIGAGLTGPLSCNGTSASNCALSLVNHFWLWKAIAPGTASIQVAPQCTTATPPCATPAQMITISIQP